MRSVSHQYFDFRIGVMNIRSNQSNKLSVVCTT
jgi:hypothetical protein